MDERQQERKKRKFGKKKNPKTFRTNIIRIKLQSFLFLNVDTSFPYNGHPKQGDK